MWSHDFLEPTTTHVPPPPSYDGHHHTTKHECPRVNFPRVHLEPTKQPFSFFFLAPEFWVVEGGGGRWWRWCFQEGNQTAVRHRDWARDCAGQMGLDLIRATRFPVAPTPYTPFYFNQLFFLPSLPFSHLPYMFNVPNSNRILSSKHTQFKFPSNTKNFKASNLKFDLNFT